MHLSRRSLLKYSGAASVGAGLTAYAGNTATASPTTVALSDFGSPSAADNSGALTRAMDAAGPGGTVTVSPGHWNMAQTVNINSSVSIVGDKPSGCVFVWTSGAYGLSINSGAGGTTIRHLAMRSSGGATSSFVHIGADTTVDSCVFYEPALYGNDVYSGTLTVTHSTYLGRATSDGTAIQVGSGANLNATSCRVSGLYQGFIANDGGDIRISDCEFHGLWFASNSQVAAGQVSAATSTSLTLAAPLTSKHASGVPDFSAPATVVAWESLTTTASLDPVEGKTGWFTATNFTPEARQMVRSGNRFSIVLRTDGSQVYLPYWYQVANCYLASTPHTSQTGVQVERPYIGHLTSLSDTEIQVASWHAGGKGTNDTPPAGARLQVNRIGGYQCFATGGTQSFTVDSCTVTECWADSISSIRGHNVSVTNCTIYDGQDVGITLENITGDITASKNIIYRAGTAGIYIGSAGASVHDNQVNGANLLSDDDVTYCAYTIQGADGATLTNNTATYLGAPKERAAIYLEGRVGQDNTNSVTQQQPPYATNVTLTGNTYSGYPTYDVSVSGTHATTSSSTSWAVGTRFEYVQGATASMIGQ